MAGTILEGPRINMSWKPSRKLPQGCFVPGIIIISRKAAVDTEGEGLLMMGLDRREAGVQV